MRAGDLDRVIIIERPTIAPDLYGTVINTWAAFATLRAKLMQFTTDDREGQRGHTTDAVITFRTRWLDGLTLEHRVIYQDDAYTIRGLKELGRRVGWDIQCERVGV